MANEVTPEKWFVGAIALIRRSGAAGDDEWLALWNAGRNCYQFVETHKLENESFRESLQREISWTTGLETGRDFLVSNVPRTRLQFLGGTGCAEEPVGYVVEFFLVELMGKRHAAILEGHELVRWVGQEELHVGKATDDRAICPQLTSLLERGDVIPPWRPAGE